MIRVEALQNFWRQPPGFAAQHNHIIRPEGDLMVGAAPFRGQGKEAAFFGTSRCGAPECRQAG